MSRIARASELIGKPVLTLDSGTFVGEIRDVLIDPGQSRAIAFTVRGRSLLSPALVGVLSADAVSSIGRDALMVATADDLAAKREGASTSVAEQDVVIGKEALTAAGESLGTVSDVILEIRAADASVVGYELTNGTSRLIVPITESVAVSGDALLMPHDVVKRAATGLSSFRESLSRTRA